MDPTRWSGSSFSYIDVSAVSSELWRVRGATRHTASTAPSRARKLVEPNDVIFATVRPTLKRIAMIPQDLNGAVVSTAFCVLRADRAKADPRFIYYAVLTDAFAARLVNLQRGASYPAVSDGDVLDQEVVAPPIAEQCAIADVLSKIHTAVEVKENIVAALKQLKAATMAKLFREGLRGQPLKQTEIGEIPESWATVPLGEIASVGNGSTPKRDNPKYWEGGTVPWLTSAKVHESVIETADEFVTDAARTECHLPLVRKRSIVIAITGQGKTLGHAAMVMFDTCVSQHLAYVQSETNEIRPEFLLHFLQGRYHELRQVSRAGGSTRGALTCAFLKRYPVPLPPLSDQQRIATILDGLTTRLEREESRRRNLLMLFSSTLQALMTGQVRVPAEMVAQLGGGPGAAAVGRTRGAAEERKGGRPGEAVLQEIVRRIVEAVTPEKIILFGSAARGEMGPDSDLDLLVVKACEHRREVARAVRACLRGLAPGRGKDVVVVTPADVERDGDTIGYVIRPALREGRVVYAA